MSLNVFKQGPSSGGLLETLLIEEIALGNGVYVCIIMQLWAEKNDVSHTHL